ncbi:hypothetical protein C4D60_Mb05t29610 [Musa balbisiana]|uniref:Uncharacterized protein n=1 Tax=Musa balbisiana TaxID=52838 RepID=A0A4S8JZQ6_MUSBA|nr:hypothetical protein C4D60_Mb05t29610 [Musa balbisiana]
MPIRRLRVDHGAMAFRPLAETLITSRSGKIHAEGALQSFPQQTDVGPFCFELTRRLTSDLNRR